jgi:hypothetical protein
LKQTTETPKADLPKSVDGISQLEKEKTNTERQSRLGAEAKIA